MCKQSWILGRLCLCQRQSRGRHWSSGLVGRRRRRRRRVVARRRRGDFMCLLTSYSCIGNSRYQQRARALLRYCVDGEWAICTNDRDVGTKAVRCREGKGGIWGAVHDSKYMNSGRAVRPSQDMSWSTSFSRIFKALSPRHS